MMDTMISVRFYELSSGHVMMYQDSPQKPEQRNLHDDDDVKHAYDLHIDIALHASLQVNVLCTHICGMLV